MYIKCGFNANQEYKYHMNVSLGRESIIRRSSKPGSPSQSGCGLNRKEKLFANLADHCQLSILQSLCKGAKTDAQIDTATSLSQRDGAFQLERLLMRGWVKSTGAEHSVLYGFCAPWLLQLEGIVDAMLTAALKGHRATAPKSRSLRAA